MKIVHGIAEGQVLQRIGRKGAEASISGDAPGEGPVFATLSNAGGTVRGWDARQVGEAARGSFSARLSGIPAGGPYRLELRTATGRAAVVKEFFVGDVWLLAGQSNMQGCGKRDGAAKPHPLVRAFSMRREWRRAADPLHILSESPDACHHGANQCTPEEGERLRKVQPAGVGAGVFFGREMVERSGVPQGLICVAHGGTSMQQWSPERKGEGGASLYASMLASWKATGQPVAGLLWYQGESDASVDDAPLYTQRMKQLVAATRRDLRQPGLPWIVVQIARVFGKREKSQVQAWNSIQEQQRLLLGQIKGLEVVSAIDLTLDDSIHISAAAFPSLANRLARAADRLVLGNPREKGAPRLASITPLGLKDGGLAFDLRFENVVGGLHSTGAPAGFFLLDEEGGDLCQVYKTTLHGDTVRIYSKVTLGQPLWVSYGHGVIPHCNIVDGRGFSLPVLGPVPVTRPAAYLPWVTTWKVSKVVPASLPLAKLAVPEVEAHEPALRSYNEPLRGFINERPRWEGKVGYNYFATQICLPEPMRLEFLMGYDGPFRLWLDGKPFFQDLAGTNPCIPDEGRKTVSLSAGVHDIRVAMDLNHGNAWGFFLRFARKDVTPARIESGDYAKAEYSDGEKFTR